MNIKLYSFIVLSLLCGQLYGLKLTRVIVSADANPLYIQFWPLVARAWKKVVGLQPTLAFIGPEEHPLDTTCGDVIRFEPIPGIPISLQAQVIRLLLPALFEEDGCVISDIDMLPMPGMSNYLFGPAQRAPDNAFIVYRPDFYFYDGVFPTVHMQQLNSGTKGRFPMCYVAAQGATFKEIFGVNKKEDIPTIISAWHQLDYKWPTDELVLYKYLVQWPHYNTRCIRVHNDRLHRLDRAAWNYNSRNIKLYTDAHMLRPYSKHKKEIDKLVRAIGATVAG